MHQRSCHPSMWDVDVLMGDRHSDKWFGQSGMQNCSAASLTTPERDHVSTPRCTHQVTQILQLCLRTASWPRGSYLIATSRVGAASSRNGSNMFEAE